MRVTSGGHLMEEDFVEAYVGDISRRHIAVVFLEGICGRYFWESYVGGILGGICCGYFWEEYLGIISGKNMGVISGRYSWSAYVGGISWRHMLGVFLGGLYEGSFQQTYAGGNSVRHMLEQFLGVTYGRYFWEDLKQNVFSSCSCFI